MTSADKKYLTLRDENGKQRAELDEQLRSFIKTVLSDLESRLKNQFDTKMNELSTDIKGLRQKVLIDAVHLHRNLGDDRAEEKLWSLAYINYYRGLEAAIELDWDIWINSAFNSVMLMLDKGAEVATLTRFSNTLSSMVEFCM